MQGMQGILQKALRSHFHEHQVFPFNDLQERVDNMVLERTIFHYSCLKRGVGYGYPE